MKLTGEMIEKRRREFTENLPTDLRERVLSGELEVDVDEETGLCLVQPATDPRKMKPTTWTSPLTKRELPDVRAYHEPSKTWRFAVLGDDGTYVRVDPESGESLSDFAVWTAHVHPDGSFNALEHVDLPLVLS